MSRTQKETTFQGKLYTEKNRETGARQLVLTQADWAAVMADAAVQAATTVAGLRTAITDAIAALT